MNIAIKINEKLIESYALKYFLSAISEIKCVLFIIYESEEEKEQLQKLCPEHQIVDISDLKQDDFSGYNDIVIGNIDFIKRLKINIFNNFILADTTSWADIYD